MLTPLCTSMSSTASRSRRGATSSAITSLREPPPLQALSIACRFVGRPLVLLIGGRVSLRTQNRWHLSANNLDV